MHNISASHSNLRALYDVKVGGKFREIACTHTHKKTTIMYKLKYNIITTNCVFEFDAIDTIYDMYCWRRGIPSCIFFFKNKIITNHFRSVVRININLVN